MEVTSCKVITTLVTVTIRIITCFIAMFEKRNFHSSWKGDHSNICNMDKDFRWVPVSGQFQLLWGYSLVKKLDGKMRSSGKCIELVRRQRFFVFFLGASGDPEVEKHFWRFFGLAKRDLFASSDMAFPCYNKIYK